MKKIINKEQPPIEWTISFGLTEGFEKNDIVEHDYSEVIELLDKFILKNTHFSCRIQTEEILYNYGGDLYSEQMISLIYTSSPFLNISEPRQAKTVNRLVSYISEQLKQETISVSKKTLDCHYYLEKE